MSSKHSFQHAPMAYVFVCLGLGMLLQEYISFDLSLIIVALGILYFAAYFLNRLKMVSSVLLLLVFLSCGAMYIQQFNTFSPDHIVKSARFYYGKPIRMQGVVVSDVEVRDTMRGTKTRFNLQIEHVETSTHREAVTGKILVNIFREAKVSYGDRIILEGKIHKPFNFKTDGQFSYRRYLKNRGVYYIFSVKKSAELHILSQKQGSVFRSAALRLRHKIKALFDEHLTRSEAGIMKAIIVGDRTGVPDHIRELFVKTGTAHILAISGLHIGMITGMIWGFLKIIRLPRPVQLIGTMILLAGYVLLTGGRASVIRAFLMAIVFLTSLLIEREHNLLNTLSLAGIVLLIFNPNYLFDVGFQLSFTCLFSIVLLVPKIEGVMSLLPGSLVKKEFVRGISYSIGIWIGTVGIIAYYFRIVTPSGILANPLIIVLLTLVIILAIGFIFAGIFFGQLSVVFALCLKAALNMMVLVAFLFSQLPFSHFFIKAINIWCIIIYHIFLIVLIMVPMSIFRSKFLIKLTSGMIDKIRGL